MVLIVKETLMNAVATPVKMEQVVSIWKTIMSANVSKASQEGIVKSTSMNVRYQIFKSIHP